MLVSLRYALVPVVTISLATRAGGQTAPTDIGTVQATGAGGAGAAAKPDPLVPQTAAQFAPSRPDPNQVEPTSTLTAETLQKLAVPTEDYNDIVRLTPSAMDISPVGPGLQQDFGQSIRGLQYTQFSVLYDGVQIPGFPFNFAPQPGAYFMEHDLGSITVHRGPGPASTVATATFGGYVALGSPKLSLTPFVNLYATGGSFGTRLAGVEAQTGAIGELNGARGMIDLADEDADGATSGTNTRRRNLFAKVELPVGESTVVTLLTNLDNDKTRTPYGVTLANINRYGPNYALNQDPKSQTFAAFSHDIYTTDFEYARIKSELAEGLTLDDTLYTGSYYQRTQHALDVGGQAPNLQGLYAVGNQLQDLTGDVPGTRGQYDFRAIGNIFRLAYDTPFGQARAGVWVEREHFTTYQYTADLTRGSIAYAPAIGASPFFLKFRTNLTTIQPYAEFAYKPVDSVTITAGVKFSDVRRSLVGEVGLIGGPQNQVAHYDTWLPSIDANWKVRPDVSVFFQAARGYLTPNLNLFATTVVPSVKPSTTSSYQLGAVFQNDELSLAVNGYLIDFDNYVNSNTVGGFTTYFNQGGAQFKGIEVEGTVKLPAHFALYANGTLNDSNYTTNGNNLAQTPRRTAAVGLIYDRGQLLFDGDDLHAIIYGKHVGPQYGLDTANARQFDQFPIKSYNQVDLDIGYVFPVRGKQVRLDLNVYNLLNDKSITGYAGNTIGPPSEALFWVNPGMSAYVSASVKL